MADTTASTGEVYPDDIQQLLTKHSKYHDVGSLAFAAYLIRQAEITEQNREAFRKELSLMKELYSKLVIQRDTSSMEIKTLSERQMSSCEELAKKVLLAKIEPLELAGILNVRLDLAEELKESSSATSNDPEEPSQDIHGKLQCISTKIKDHRERFKCCLSLLQNVSYFNSVLESRLEREESIIRRGGRRQEGKRGEHN
ncbi:hypothetical protein C5167_000495 [Papaver somniferum]|uniref:Uncharacterized protein n=1 Tax=Papaver somniferum TaxID=3469 RepID=A0A4Y7KVK7_PAPSO|nr:uncharacterized protein LOC113308052 [Papaver somniferum]XP_026412305.1 uncharacterized protein LOC113308052 [Papaver somniferum]RZC76400.1 hypothetical protein C5167_000495 [Papaver somniferum]